MKKIMRLRKRNATKIIDEIINDIKKTSDEVDDAYAQFDKKAQEGECRREKIRETIRNGAGYYKSK